MPILGHHLLLDLWDVDPAALDDAEALELTMTRAAQAGGATVVESRFHRFAPHGISGVLILAESHLSVHTWPELGFAACDVFTCGHDEVAQRIGDEIVGRLAPGRIERRIVGRGAEPTRVEVAPEIAADRLGHDGMSP